MSPEDIARNTKLHNLIRSFGYTTNSQTADIVDALMTAEPTHPASVGTSAEGYRRGLKDAFHSANITKAYSRGTPKETCAEIIRTLADLVNGGERATEIALSGKSSRPFPARMLNESDESVAGRVDSWHKFATQTGCDHLFTNGQCKKCGCISAGE